MPQTSDSEYFIAKAEQCFRLAHDLRCEHSVLEVATELDAVAHEFLARAVALDTERDRIDTQKRRGQG